MRSQSALVHIIRIKTTQEAAAPWMDGQRGRELQRSDVQWSCNRVKAAEDHGTGKSLGTLGLRFGQSLLLTLLLLIPRIPHPQQIVYDDRVINVVLREEEGVKTYRIIKWGQCNSHIN